MKKIVSILCGIILATTALWAEQINVTLSAPDHTSNPLVTQKMGTLGGENTLEKAWSNGEQTGLLLNKDLAAFQISNKASITFSSPQYTIFHKYSFNVWKDGEYDGRWLDIIPYYGINTNNPDQKPTSTSAQDPQYIEKLGYTSNTLTFTTQRTGGKIGRLDVVYDIFSNNWKFGITIPEVILPTDNPTTILNKITESELLEGEPTRNATLRFTVRDPIGINSTTIKDYFEPSIISSNGNTWSLGDTWTVVEEASNYLVKIPVTFQATTDDAGIFQATIQLKPKHNVQYNGTDYSVGRTQIVKVAVNQKSTYSIDWKPDGWVDGGTITIFKGDSYERNDYLKNTDGLTLDKPASSNSGVVSVDPTTGKITATEVGSTVLTYVQKGNDDYEDKTLTLTVNVIKRTPVFTLNSESTYTENGNTYHVFYPNKSYPNFVTTTNGDLVNYPVTITPEGDMTNIISFNGVSAKVESALRDGIKITIFQRSGDLWMEKSQVFYISIRNNPMHVGTLCEQSLENLFKNAYAKYEAKYEDGAIVLGSKAINTTGGNIIFRFEGTPDELIWNKTTTQGAGYETWEVTQSDNGIDFIPLEDGTKFRSEARYVKLSISGTYEEWFTKYGVMGKITDICITERVGVEILPAEIELVKMGNEVKSAAFSTEVSNLTKVVLTISSSEFGLARTESSTPQSSITLDYMDGLGIDQFATIPLVVKYKGVVDDSAIGKTCTITAKDADGNQLAVANVKVTGIILVDGVPQTILQPNATNTGIYTGTNKNSNAFPYKPKAEVDLSATFDANGTALFDYLYIFGLTTPADNNSAGNLKVVRGRYERNQNIIPDAVTPCYIYKRTDAGNGYIHQTTIPNMNVTSSIKPIGTIAADRQKIYFTGHCPYASSGTANDQIGVFCFTGGAGAKVDLYFEDLYLHARPHTDNGACFFKTTDTVRVELHLGSIDFIPASASPFVFQSTSGAPFYPTIHLRDSNRLDGGMGAIQAGAVGITKDAGFYSAPIQIYATSEDEAVELSIDDKWPIEYGGIQMQRTNGKLNLCPTDVQRPSIELGNDKSRINFNGGQIYLKNSELLADVYLSTFAIGRRFFRYEVSVISATLCGLGDDQPGGHVNFNDGSIYSEALSESFMNGRLGKYYRTANSLKCPVDTKINGGTYYCDIWSCTGPEHLGASPSDQYGNPLVTARFPINNQPESPFYLATVNWDSIADNLVCQQEHAYKGLTLRDYYDGKTSSYSHSSLKADKTDSVTFMLPYQFTDKMYLTEEFIYNWIFCTPSLNAGALGFTETFGGPKTVPSSPTEHTMYLLYAEADDYAMAVAGPGAGYITPDVGLGESTVELNEDELRNDIENTSSYRVEGAQYIIKPIAAADKWMLFCPPFDITNVYVVEAYPEEKLVTMAAEDTHSAYLQQAKSSLDVFTYLGFDMEFNKTDVAFWNIYDKWFKDATIEKGRGKVNLKHFTGSNYDAHYYLQRSSGTWTWNGTKFTTDWEYLPSTPEKVTHGTTQYDVVMKKGEIYSMNFPYMYDGYMEEDRATWDYWTGKYLIFEGLGPQTIEGKDFHQDVILNNMNVTAGQAQVRGNFTLAAVNVQNPNAYYLYYDGSQKFVNSANEEEILPTEGFVLAGMPSGAAMPGRRATIDMMDGTVNYQDEEENDFNTPTIAPDRNLLVYTTPTGLAVIPVIPQHVAIYNTAGQLVTSQHVTEETQFDLPSGIYFVCGETDRAKAMVK